MSNRHEDSDSAGDLNDDGQLTIRIPNPKVYMERQSQWIGRRGKPRCDHCRTNNLKCDRVLPTCNHCSWANNRDCKYTPLPTPAHRGIPRCDRCRAKKMRCDRNLPICNNCKEHGRGTSCNYTPKKRHRSQMEHELNPSLPETTGPKSWPKPAGPSPPRMEPGGDRRGHTFYGQNVAALRGRSLSPGYSTASDMDSTHTGRFTADFSRTTFTNGPPSYRQIGGPQFHPPGSQLEFIPHAFPAERKFLTSRAHIEPWTHPLIVGLSRFACQRLSLVNPVEMPSRREFESGLSAFVHSMMKELRDTVCLSMEAYGKVWRCLATGDTSSLAKHVRTWTSVHRLKSGSDKYNLILVPRDSVFYMEKAEAEAHKQRFIADVLDLSTDINTSQVHHYDRLPVQNQVYDILTYAHRSHVPAAQMLVEVARLGFASVTWPMAEMYVRSCPLCNLRSKQDRSHQNPSL
ncbi:hypothetical protein B0H34DRAFT_699058 [Crassisporium funariophilum]|nr:hypothetical protein B0H34DRAFT_699058 [Crassisporium funariophilum]